MIRSNPMKTLLSCLCLLASCAFGQSWVVLKGAYPVVDANLTNRYGVASTPWYIYQDTVRADTTGNGTWKRMGLRDTSRAIFIRNTMGQWSVAATRRIRATANSDSGAYLLRPQFYSTATGKWMVGLDLAKTKYPGDSSFYDTLLTVSRDTAGWTQSAILWPQADSVRFVVEAAAGTTNGDTLNLTTNRLIGK
jgi:hypothetical protein